MKHDIEYDSNCECYVWWHDGAGMCLASETQAAAIIEVDGLIAMGQYPEASILPEGEDGVTYYDDFCDTDALASAGMGTDEDYGCFGSDE